MYLLDTHVLLHALLAPDRLSQKHSDLFRQDPGPFHFSSVSIWEIALKYNIGKLQLHGHDPEKFLSLCYQSGFQLDELSASQMATFGKMPLGGDHKDPFDRMLIWQSIQNKRVLLSVDNKFEQYRKLGLQLIA